MHIALASIHPRPLSGQIEELVGLSQALETRGHRVFVVSAFPNETLLGPQRLGLTSAHKWGFIDHPIRAARILTRLVALSSQVDLIQLNLPTPAFSMLADWLQALVRVPVVVSYEAHLFDSREGLRREYLRQSPAFYLPRLAVNNRLISRLTLHSAAQYLVGSEYQRAELIALGIAPRKILRLPNLLPLDKLERGDRAMTRARLALPPGRWITYVGHFNHVKGTDVLVEAFGKLAARYDDLQLLLAWSGLGHSRPVESRSSQPHLQGRIHQLGRVQVMELLAASDLAVLPYRLTIGQAAFPASLREAFAANVPVVTSDLPLLRELTEGGELALLAPPDDAAGLARAIERVLIEPALRERIVSAQQLWLERMHPTRVAKSYEHVYRRAIAARQGAWQPAQDHARVDD